MRYVDEPSREVSGVRGTERHVGESFTGAVGRDEVFEYGKPLTEVGLDRDLDRVARCVCHESAHAADLSDLVFAAAGAGRSHDVEVVRRLERIHQSVRDVVRRFVPDLDDFFVSLVV